MSPLDFSLLHCLLFADTHCKEPKETGYQLDFGQGNWKSLRRSSSLFPRGLIHKSSGLSLPVGSTTWVTVPIENRLHENKLAISVHVLCHSTSSEKTQHRHFVIFVHWPSPNDGSWPFRWVSVMMETSRVTEHCLHLLWLCPCLRVVVSQHLKPYECEI